MSRKCHTCLCRTCLNTCCNRKNCTEKKESCDNYRGFRQMSIFDAPEQKTKLRGSAPRFSWDELGIDKRRYNQLTAYITSGEYASLASSVAHRATKNYARHILLSIVENLSYDDFERMWTLGEIDRIPVGRSDFYGWRRWYYHEMDLEFRRMGK